MKETPRYFDHHDIVAHEGINKIDNRTYYCYIDTNNTVVVIPNWYRWVGVSFLPIGYALGLVFCELLGRFT